MKSIVLCEKKLVKHQDTKNLKGNVQEEKVEEKEKLNGTADEKFESDIPDCNSDKKENFLQRRKKSTTKGPSVVEVSENGEDKIAEETDNSEVEKCARSDEKSMTVKMEMNTSSNDEGKNCLEGARNCFDVSENLRECSKGTNSFNQVSNPEKKKPILSTDADCFDEVCDEINEVSIIDDSEEVTEEVSVNSTSKDLGSRLSPDLLSKIKVRKSKQSLNDEGFDVDSNKENVKDEKTNSMEDLPKDGEEEGNGCGIQVEKVQSVSIQDSDFIWLSSESEKSQQDLEEMPQEKQAEDSEDVSTCNEGLQKISEEEKETDCQAIVVIDSVSSEHVESEELQMEVEEADQIVDISEEENKSERTEWDESSGETESKKTETCDESGVNVAVSNKKRPITDGEDEEPTIKKIKLSESKKADVDKLKVGSLADVDSEGDSSKVKETSLVAEATEEKVTDEEKDANAEDSEKEDESSASTSSFLSSFRGTLKNLTRSDLEELIVQKLCEVITERSTVGELRRKAQALEQDQERWKLKVQLLSKQMKEMEMVMKKYMSEVQKQLKDGTSHMTTPLRVTRSVGLQVSFYTYPNRGSKPNVSPSATPSPAQNINTRNSKGSPKPSHQYSPVSQNLRSKSMPVTPKTSPSLQKAPVIQQRRHSVAPNSIPPNRTVTTATTPITNRPVQAQVPRPVYKPVISTAPQQQQQEQQQSQQQQQHGSKVIDLTEDDDQKINNTGKPNIPTKVVSQLPQVQSGTPPSNRYAYLVPATSTSTGLGGAQNRQVLIATPAIQTPQQNRQIMCSMPPLLFKGGNQVQNSTQPPAINQNNSRVILPKVLRHPAPLPQAPIRNWANMKQLPPRPALKISKVQTGIVLSWNMVLGPEHAPIRSYQLYAYQESNSPPATSLWKKVGDVKALPLPMACTLTQFMSGHKYHFAVRAVDLHSRNGPFSFPGTIVLVK